MTLFLNWYQRCLCARRVRARQIFQLKRTRLSADPSFRNHFHLFMKSASGEVQNRASRKPHLSFCVGRVVCQGMNCTEQSLELISSMVTQPGDLHYFNLAAGSAMLLSSGSIACYQHRCASLVMAVHANNVP